MCESTNFMKVQEGKNVRLWLGILLLVGILLRVALFVNYPAVSYDDTHSYRRSANALLNGLNDYDGTRTPGYPTFMALVGPDRAVYAAQLVMGLGITLCWFLIGWKASGKLWFGALVGLAHTLDPGQLLFEANLLTETLTTFWLVLSFLGAFYWFTSPEKRSFWLGLGIGLSASLAALSRPLFIFMPILAALFIFVSYEEGKLHLHWKPLISVLLPALLLIGGWMSWINQRFGVFSLSTMTGYHLMQHTGYYFEDAPDEYAAIRDVYLEYRDQRIAEYGTQGNTIWRAIPAMKEASGLGFYELSRTLQDISVQLILTHPLEYLSRVLKGWWLFWRAPVYWDSSMITSAVLASAVNALVLAARGLLFLTNMIFILSSLLALLLKRLRQLWRIQPFHWLLCGSVWAASILSSLLDHGDNPRFLVPLQTVVVFWVLWIGYQTWQSRMKPKVLSGMDQYA